MIATSKRKLLPITPPAEAGGQAATQLSLSVAGLVFVMPPVKVVVKQDDASRGHARNDAPGRTKRRTGLQIYLFPRVLFLKKELPSLNLQG